MTKRVYSYEEMVLIFKF